MQFLTRTDLDVGGAHIDVWIETYEVDLRRVDEAGETLNLNPQPLLIHLSHVKRVAQCRSVMRWRLVFAPGGTQAGKTTLLNCLAAAIPMS